MKLLIVSADTNYIYTFSTWVIILITILFPFVLIFDIKIEQLYVKISVVMGVLSSIVLKLSSYYTEVGYVLFKNNEIHLTINDKKYIHQKTEDLDIELFICGFQSQLLKGKFMIKWHDGLKNELKIDNEIYEILLHNRNEMDYLKRMIENIGIKVSPTPLPHSEAIS